MRTSSRSSADRTLLRPRVLALVVTVTAGCNPAPRPAMHPDALRGWVMDEPIEKADFQLASAAGDTLRFREDTEGYVTFLFFGYTSCPDVCPLHMANLGAVIDKLTPEVARRIKVVFVSTDPERDTPERIRAWLDHFSRDFIGLYGPLDKVNEIQASFGLGASYRDETPTGEYGVAHASQVLAFTPDNRAHVMYPFGIRQADWAHDLPLLVRDGARAADR